MAWCPITNLQEANLSYEWNMGQFASAGTRASATWTSAYSADLAKAWPKYLNRPGLRDQHGRRLELTESSSGTYLAGSYYDHLIEVITTSLNHFLREVRSTEAVWQDGGWPYGVSDRIPCADTRVPPTPRPLGHRQSQRSAAPPLGRAARVMQADLVTRSVAHR
jgi:hypothetical protein